MTSAPPRMGTRARRGVQARESTETIAILGAQLRRTVDGDVHDGAGVSAGSKLPHTPKLSARPKPPAPSAREQVRRGRHHSNAGDQDVDVGRFVAEGGARFRLRLRHARMRMDGGAVRLTCLLVCLFCPRASGKGAHVAAARDASCGVIMSSISRCVGPPYGTGPVRRLSSL